MEYIFEQARQMGKQTVIGEFIPTNKNKPAETFFKDCGFNKISSSDRGEVWRYTLPKKRDHHLDYIEIIEKENL